jgi:hypothetical protein
MARIHTSLAPICGHGQHQASPGVLSRFIAGVMRAGAHSMPGEARFQAVRTGRAVDESERGWRRCWGAVDGGELTGEGLEAVVV